MNAGHMAGTQHMTSLEIADLTGKQHKNVMRDIRNMEPAWEKVCGLNFELTSRIIIQPNGGTREVPCYSLPKTECLYIATKFNDEARARLVLRWEELEHERYQQGAIRKLLVTDMDAASRNTEQVHRIITIKTTQEGCGIRENGKENS